MSTEIAVIGAGAWGTALAIAATRAGRTVTLWSRDEAHRAVMRTEGRNAKALPDAPFPENLIIAETAADAAQSPVLILGIPTQALRSGLNVFAPLIAPGTAVIGAAKGIEQASGSFVSEMIGAILPEAQIGILSGPSFAADVARGLPTAVTLAARDAALAERLATLLGSGAFRIYHTDDVRGVEIGGAAKNVLAIAAGIVVGAGLGESARAALVTRGFAELRRFAAAYDGRPETLMGLSGLGDLLLSASSSQSRNFACGLALGRGAPIQQAGAGKLAEGMFTAPILVEKARARGVEMPICAAVAALLAGKVTVDRVVETLLSRPQKGEA